MKQFFRLLVSLFFAVTLVSCATSQVRKKKSLVQATAPIRKEYIAAKKAYEGNNTKVAASKLRQFVQKHPGTDVTDDARYMLAKLQAASGNHVEAYESYSTAALEANDPVLETEAEIRGAQSAVKAGKTKEARELLVYAQKKPNLTPERRAIINETWLEIATLEGDSKTLLKAISILSDSHPNQAKRDQYRARAYSMIDSLSPSDLSNLRNDDGLSAVRPYLKFRFAETLANQQNFSGARDEFNQVMLLAPGTEIAERAKQVLGELDSRQKVNPRVIGVVLPLSGRQANVGQRTLKGIQLGLGIYGKAPSGFELAVIDSQSSPDGGRRAVERLIAEDNVISIIGGLSSRTAAAEASRAQDFGVPFIALTQKAGLTSIGSNVFRNALTSEMQVAELVRIAMEQRKMTRFAILFPNDAYGVEYANLFWDEVRRRGGTIVGSQVYDPKETDFRGPIQRLTGLFYWDDRTDEYKAKLKEWQEKNPSKTARSKPPPFEELLRPVVNFEALFIPDSTKALGQIAPMLLYNDVENVKLLGTNLWNTNDVAQRGQKLAEDSLFVDSFVSNDPRFTNSEFVANFKSAFGAEVPPGVFEVQGYDSGLLLRQIIAGGENSRVGVAQRLSAVENFSGALGPLTVNENREIRRPVVGLTVTEGQILPASPSLQ